jgi:hypothetical protein
MRCPSVSPLSQAKHACPHSCSWLPTATRSAIQDSTSRNVPLGIGNSGFFESYEELLDHSPLQRPFYGLHLDAQDRWIDHHAVGVDGPLLHWDANDPSTLHFYLLSYERHALLNHFVLTCPSEACPRH